MNIAVLEICGRAFWEPLVYYIYIYIYIYIYLFIYKFIKIEDLLDINPVA